MERSSDSLADEVAIVTGGSRGIGRAIVSTLLEHGASVAFCGRDEEAGRQAEAEFGAPERVAFRAADVAADFNAVEMTEEEWDRFFAVDLKAAWLAAKHVLPHMRRAGQGSIVNISSLHGYVTLDGFFPYAAAKSGLLGLTRSLALDYGPDGIRVNVVAPGFIRTRLVQESIDRAQDKQGAEAAMVAGVALGRIGLPEEVARTVRFL